MNLFYSYRNGHLEDNLTRALLVTLKGCGDRVTSRFLRKFCRVSAHGAFEYALQSGPERNNCKEWQFKCILAITGRRLQEVETEEVEHIRPNGGSRPDGWVLSQSRNVAVLVESKLGDTYDRWQIERHCRQHLGLIGKRPEIASWDNVGEFFHDIARARPASALTGYLSQQFVEYLDLLGFMPFDGFHEHHFRLGQQRRALEGFVKALGMPGLERQKKGACDYSFPQMDGGGNLGIAMWGDDENPRDTLSTKLSIGARYQEDTDRVIEAMDSSEGTRRVLDFLRQYRHVPIWCVVKVRAKAGQQSNYIDPAHSEVMNHNTLELIMRKLRKQHLRAYLSRSDTLSFARALGNKKAELSLHKRFLITSGLLFGTDLEDKQLTSMTLQKVVDTVRSHLGVLEELRIALGLT